MTRQRPETDPLLLAPEADVRARLGRYPAQLAATLMLRAGKRPVQIARARRVSKVSVCVALRRARDKMLGPPPPAPPPRAGRRRAQPQGDRPATTPQPPALDLRPLPLSELVGLVERGEVPLADVAREMVRRAGDPAAAAAAHDAHQREAALAMDRQLAAARDLVGRAADCALEAQGQARRAGVLLDLAAAAAAGVAR